MKRKSRDKIDKGKINMMKPIPFELLGTADDPCFAQHHDVTASACQECGDAEICAIATAQKLHLTRKAIEAKQPFKDIKEEPQSSHTWKTLYKSCKRILKKYPKGIRIEVLEKKLTMKLGITPEEFRNLLTLSLKKKSKFLKDTNKLITYKK